MKEKQIGADVKMVGIQEEDKAPFLKSKCVHSFPTNLKPGQQSHSDVSRAEADDRKEQNGSRGRAAEP